MNSEKTNEILDMHKKYLMGDSDGVMADLHSADLHSANLRSADLRSADLRYADLRYADLSYADLRSADLRYADLRYADLRSADLRYADLSYSDLSYADLRYADLRSADLHSADLRKANYSILNVMRSRWGTVSDSLCLEMMRWDAVSCGDEAMQVWVESGTCPFIRSGREFHYSENKKLWVPGKPQMNHKELFIALCKEKNIKI
jgi:hypothetical protein